MTVYSTGWIPNLTVEGPAAFLTKSLAYHAVRAVPHRLRRSRTPATVRKSYDESRLAIARTFESIDWDTYTRFAPDLCDFTLLDGQLRWGSLRQVRDRMIARLRDAVATLSGQGRVVVEFGSGDGRNLLVLGRAFPEMQFVGLELSPVSVELSRTAATRFDVTNVQFVTANVCEPLPPVPFHGDVALAYSCFALEMMPRIFTRAIGNMAAVSRGSLVFFEPISELWPHDVRGLTSRLRVFQLDRLSGFIRGVRSTLDAREWVVRTMNRTGLALNPLNEMCEVRFDRKTR
jgi:hypothetical protein